MNSKVMHFYWNAPVSYLREKLIALNSTPDGLGSWSRVSSFQKTKKKENTDRVKEFLIGSLHIDPTELNNEIDKVHRLPLTNKQKQSEKTWSTPSIKFYSYREKRFSKRNELYNNSNKKITFHDRLRKHRLDLPEKAQNRNRNLLGIKFFFADPNSNLKIEFNDNKNKNFDSLSLWRT